MAERELELDLLASSADRTAAETERLRDEIKQALTRLNTVLSHYYTDEAVQSLAEETGGCVADSLEMARFGASVAAETIVVAGVRFMGETKILSPSKRVFPMPTLRQRVRLISAANQALFLRFVMRIRPNRGGIRQYFCK